VETRFANNNGSWSCRRFIAPESLKQIEAAVVTPKKAQVNSTPESGDEWELVDEKSY